MADRHRVDAIPDPTFYFDADPDPDPDFTCVLHIMENLLLFIHSSASFILLVSVLDIIIFWTVYLFTFSGKK